MRDNKTQKSSAKAQNDRALWKLVVAGIAVFSATAIALTLIFSSVGIRGTVRKIAKAYRKGDVQQLCELTWYPYESVADADEKAQDEAIMQLFLQSRTDGIQQHMKELFDGKRGRLGYQITGIEPMQQSWIDSVNRMLEANDADGRIEDAKLVEVTFTAKRGGKTETLSPETFRLVKVDGRWYLTYEGAFDQYG